MNPLRDLYALFRAPPPIRSSCSGAPAPARQMEPAVDHVALGKTVESMLATAPQLATAQIHVEAFTGTVQLSGFVDSPAQMNRAVELAGGVDGVASVRNCLQLAWW